MAVPLQEATAKISPFHSCSWVLPCCHPSPHGVDTWGECPMAHSFQGCRRAVGHQPASELVCSKPGLDNSHSVLLKKLGPLSGHVVLHVQQVTELPAALHSFTSTPRQNHPAQTFFPVRRRHCSCGKPGYGSPVLQSRGQETFCLLRHLRWSGSWPLLRCFHLWVHIHAKWKKRRTTQLWQ